jgi:hypothetical protein
MRFFLAWIIFNAHYGLALQPGTALEHPIYFLGRRLGPLAAILGFLLISGFSIAQASPSRQASTAAALAGSTQYSASHWHST